MVATVEDGVVESVKPDTSNPIYGGYTCIKGRQLVEQMYQDARLIKPLKKNALGEFEEVTSQQALDEIAAKVAQILEESGLERSLHITARWHSKIQRSSLIRRLGTMPLALFPITPVSPLISPPRFSLARGWVIGQQAVTFSHDSMSRSLLVTTRSCRITRHLGAFHR